MRIIGVNGIATHGENNIDILLARLRLHWYETVDVKLPKRHFISAWWGHVHDAKAIYDASEDGDVVIAHSFGGPRTVEAMHYRYFSQAFFIRPAMSKNHLFLRDEIYCFYSPDDTPVRIGAYLPFHPFGKAGIEGFSDPDAVNILSSGDHNADFHEHLDRTVDTIVKYVKNKHESG
jgi:hypothetical protein